MERRDVLAKIRYAWRCVHCSNLTLEFRRERITFCPNCGGHVWEAERFTVYVPTAEAAKRR